jgi:serine/threonine protein kinase
VLTQLLVNGGVFVVRMKNVPSKCILHVSNSPCFTISYMVIEISELTVQGRIYIEKRFKTDHVHFGRREIDMLYRLKHPALTFYSIAFITSEPNPIASVYVEFCDRGSLDDICKAYAKHPGSRVPEAFVWHTLLGLCDGLAYLQGGGSSFSDNSTVRLMLAIPI